MRKRYFTIFLLSLFAIVTNLFADNDTITYVEYYSCDFENSGQNSLWLSKNSSGPNKWYISNLGGDNTFLFVPNTGTDTAYKKNSYAISLKYTTVTLGSADSLQIEFDVNCGGETHDYLKVVIVPSDFNLPLPASLSSSLSGYLNQYNRDSAFVFSDNKCYIANTDGRKHIVGKVKNIAPCTEAKLVFIWRNDNSVGSNPGAVVDNIILKGIVKQVDRVICQGEYFTINNRNFNQSGIYFDTIPTIDAGCDSIIQYNLTVKDTLLNTIYDTLCSGQTYTISNNRILTNSGVYFDTMQTVFGCDSTEIINLTVKPVFNNILYDTVCSGTAYNFLGTDITSSGTYIEILTADNGCDSTVTLQFTVLDTYNITFSDTICSSDSYTDNGFNESSPGFYTQNLSSVQGCDSIVNLNLRVNNVLYTDIFDTVCFGQTYSDLGFEQSAEGVYTANLQSLNGCDSIVTLNLTVWPSQTEQIKEDTVEICQGESYIFANKTLTSSGIYTETLENIFGCDSIVSLNLIVNPVYWTVDSVSINQGETYTSNGKTYTTTGNYNDTLNTFNGCDSIVTICLTVLSSVNSPVVENFEQIYPNPAKSFINIDLQLSANKRFISVIDESGKSVKTIQVPANQIKTQIDVSDLTNGTYILQIYDGKKTFSKYFIIQ